MKKTKLMRIACAMLVVTLLSTCVISGTFAKYVSRAGAEDTVRVANWSILYKDGTATGNPIQIAAETPPTITFNLFNTIKDTAEGSDTEEDVVEGKIAPGTKGSFTFTITNDSEVTAHVGVSVVTKNDDNIPLTFKMGNKSSKNLNTLLSDLGTLQRGKSANYTVDWEWPFYVSDEVDESVDTKLGIKASTTDVTYKVDATIIATQVD